jgi:hypothetical protein
VGYERSHYEVSEACGERVLLPQVRSASADTLLVTAGFSCRSQIEQSTARRGLHLAQVIQLARDHGADGPRGPYPERAVVPKPQPSGRRRAATAAAVAATAAAGAFAFAATRR